MRSALTAHFCPLRWLAAASVLISANSANALDPTLRATQYQVQCYGVADGLPQGSVQAIAQHPNGDLLLGTNRGVVRFDGARVTPLLVAGSPALADVQVHRFARYQDEIWIASFGGLYRLKEEQLKLWTQAEGLPQTRVTAVLPGAEEILVGTHGGTVRIARDGDGWGSPQPIAKIRTNTFGPEADGSVWLPALDGLHRLRADGEFESISGLGLEREIFWSTLRDSSGQRWFGARTRLLRMPANDPTALESMAESSGMPALPVRQILQDRDQQLWFATAGAGLFRLKGERFERVPGLRSDVVYALNEDREGNLWAGTSGGFCRIRDGALLGFSVNEGLGTDFVVSVGATANGDVLVGSNGRGLYRIAQGSVTALGNPGNDPFVNAVAVLHGGRILVSSNAGNFEWRDDQFIALDPALLRPSFRWAAEDAEGDIWLGIGEIEVKRIAKGRVQTASFDQQAVRWGFRGRNGSVLISANAALYQVLGERTERIADISALPAPACSYQDPRGVIWCIAEGGLLRVENGKGEPIRDPEAFGKVAILALEPEADSALWLATTAGLFRASISELDAAAGNPAHRVNARRFDERHGMRSSEFTRAYSPGLSARSPDGRLWWASMAGVLVIEPQRLAMPNSPPSVRIEQLQVDGITQSAARYAALGPRIGRLEIDYSALSLTDAASLNVRHRLLPLSQEWTLTSARQLTALGLPSGSYRFEVQASFDRLSWPEASTSSASAHIDFSVLPQWHEKWAVRALLILLAALLLISVPLLRIVALRQRAKVLSAQVAERTAALTIANAQLDQIARTDALTGVANRRVFDQTLQELAQRAPEPVALLMADVDHFKAYNDQFGHPAGDACLRQVAQALAAVCARHDALLARYGGEEFAALLTGANANKASQLADQMREAVRTIAITHPTAAAGTVTISVGLAQSQGIGESTSQLLQRADQALYQAKAAGRDRTVVD